MAREGDTDAANLLNAFEGVPLDAEAQAEIYRTLTACAERRRLAEGDPENDPECDFVLAGEAGDFLGELEGGTEEDWVEYRPEGEHRWESLGEGGGAAEIDEVLRGIEERKALPPPVLPEPVEGPPAHPEALAAPPPTEPDPDDPMFDWRNWSDGGYTPPAPPSPQPPTPKPRKPYKKRQPKPPFTAPDEARKAEAVAEVAAERRVGAKAEAERRRRRNEPMP